MYRNVIVQNAEAIRLVAGDATRRYQRARTEWKKENPEGSEDYAMPDYLLRLKEQAEQAQAKNINNIIVKGAMELFPPMR